jgi:gamma-glutamyl-gamma-aminobutyrate hydrolase PuuD
VTVIDSTSTATRLRPVVGISAYSTRAAWGVWDVEAVLVPRAYVDAVERSGGLPVVLPPLPGIVEALLPRLDALLLAGGPDVEPWRYGQEPGPDTQPPKPERDAAELGLLAGAVDAGLPVLGICRGMQLINVARGGTLHQHLPDAVGHDDHAPAPGVYGDHHVRVEAGSRLARALGGRAATTVPAYHHQGLDRLGDRLVATAWSGDGLVEAVEDPALPFCVGVQWHPEVGADAALFTALVDAARARLAALAKVSR